MRQILFNWMMKVAQKFKLKKKTLFMAYSLIDSFCQKASVTYQDYQLIGITCIFISYKFEEIYYPKLEQLIAICDRAFNKEQIISKELEILDCLNYQIIKVSVMD